MPSRARLGLFPQAASAEPHRHLSPPHVTGETLRALTDTMETGQWSYGRLTQTMERDLEAFLGMPQMSLILTNGATAALDAAASLLPRMRHARVCPLTWPSTYLRVAEPQWVDSTDLGWPVSEVDIGVELWGRPWAQSGLPAPRVLDAAHRFAAPEHRRYVEGGGTLVYSFGPQKEVGTPCGGALVTLAIPRADALAYLNMGAKGRVYQGMGGTRGLMIDPIAKMLRRQIKVLESGRRQRTEVLATYQESLRNLLRTVPGEASGHLAVIDCGSPEDAAAAVSRLIASRIPWSVHYSLPDHGPIPTACPSAYALSRRILTLPCHREMDRAAVRRVCFQLLRA